MSNSECNFLEAKNISDEQWKSIAVMEEFLKNEIYPHLRSGFDTDWKKVKEKVFKNLKISDISFANNYYFFENDKAKISIEAYERKETLYFEFDYFGKTVPVEITELVFDKIREIMEEKHFEQAMFHTFEKRLYGSALKTNAEIYEESVTSILFKKDLDFKILEKIVSENIAANDFELKLYDMIPEELYERYIIYINEIYEDANEFHPKKEKPKKFSLNDLKVRAEDIKNDNLPYYLYVLFDRDNIAAFCAVFIDKADGKFFIEHRGGFTTTGRNYRGKGLARFLKAKMYLKINEDYPDFEYILTDTFPWNKYMYKVNEEFGFKPFQKGYTFRLKA
ncbi:MAG TPA: hypothetical protein PKA90_10235 [Ignavibacteria bacterium]|nr:hypothetical protein [Ignavibacteria bacterium]HMR40795.1 hypothetical protein [Ignavibacteria bacterium]